MSEAVGFPLSQRMGEQTAPAQLRRASSSPSPASLAALQEPFLLGGFLQYLEGKCFTQPLLVSAGAGELLCPPAWLPGSPTLAWPALLPFQSVGCKGPSGRLRRGPHLLLQA